MPPIIPLTQPEQVLENEIVAQLTALGYTQVAVTDKTTMLANLKAQLETFNDQTLTPSSGGWRRNMLGSEAQISILN